MPTGVKSAEPDMISIKALSRVFVADEEGAVTVDWVVLTAAIVILAAGILIGISEETRRLSGAIATEIQDANRF